MGVIVAFHSLPLLADALAWRRLYPKRFRLPSTSYWWMRWVGESLSNLLPVAQVGGDIVRARLAASRPGRKVPMSTSLASVIADITISIFTEIAFVLSGVAMLGHRWGMHSFTGPVLLGSAVMLAGVGTFWALQRFGVFGTLATLASKMAKAKDWSGLVEQGQSVDEALREMYERRGDVLLNAFWTCVSWAVGACEVWIAMYAIGIPATYPKAYVLESVGQAITDAAFLIPGAVGVFEGGYVVVGAALGIPGDAALALALIRRVREITIGVAGIILWQWIEGRRLWKPGTWKKARPRRPRVGDVSAGAVKLHTPAPGEVGQAGG